MPKLGVFFAFALVVFAQTVPQFEVATVKPNKSGSQGSAGPYVENVRFVAQNLSLKTLLAFAYGIQEFQLSGPGWLEEERFDIVANVPAGTSRDQSAPMLRTLLDDRFQVATHRRTVEMNIYALMVAKGGPKVRQIGESEPFKPQPMPPGAAYRLLFGNMTRWSAELSKTVDRPVIDKTGLTGTYRIMLAYDGGGLDSPAPTVFDALQEQTGLRMEKQTGTVEFLVVDHAERIPSEN